MGRVAGPEVPAGIYGTVICSSILASAGSESSLRVSLTVVVTLFVYWMAERYAEVLGLAASSGSAAEAEAPGPRITGAHIRHVLGSHWSMVQASVTPLAVLLGSRILGADADTAIDIALAYTMFLLVGLGWLAATRAGLTGWQRGMATIFTAMLGVVVVILKASLH